MRRGVFIALLGFGILLTCVSFSASLFCSSAAKTRAAPPSFPPKRKIVFFKTHKSGSTTLGNIIFRWAVRANLRIFCATDHIIDLNRDAGAISQQIHDVTLHHIEPGGIPFLNKLIPNAAWITVFRQPISRYLSSFYYFVKPERNITLEEVIEEKSDLYGLQTDFGLRSHNDLAKFLENQWLRFRVVVVTERWNESMVMLKDKMNWKWRDVLYLARNTCSQGTRFDQKEIHCPPSWLSLPAELRLKIQQKLAYEEVLYEKAVTALDDYIRESVSFEEDLKHYTSLLESLAKNCTSNAASEEHCAEFYLDDLDYESLTCRSQGEVPMYIGGASALVRAKKSTSITKAG
jgi:hypothetical protein